MSRLSKQSLLCLGTNTAVDIFDKYHVRDIIFYPSTIFLQLLSHIIHFTVFPGWSTLAIVIIIVIVVVALYHLTHLTTLSSRIVIAITINCDAYVATIVAIEVDEARHVFINLQCIFLPDCFCCLLSLFTFHFFVEFKKFFLRQYLLQNILFRANRLQAY